MVRGVMLRGLRITAVVALFECACASSGPPLTVPGAGSTGSPRTAGSSSSAPSGDDDALARVTTIHGGAGPWVVAGYRMGEYALVRLGLQRQSFDLEVVHHTPQEVQFSCIADGAAAATGASAGKLNLRLVDAAEADVATTYRRRSTGQAITLRPARAFTARFRDVPRDQLAQAGRVVLALPDADVFEELPASPPP
jgi:formylmethanofuran dehydrogenase subunit E